MEAERAYNISDLYILKMDLLESVDEVKTLHTEMIAFYTGEMAALDKRAAYAKPIVLCLDYIYEHLHEPIRVEQLAHFVELNTSYLSTLFKRETGGFPVGLYPVKEDGGGEEYAEILRIQLFGDRSHLGV